MEFTNDTRVGELLGADFGLLGKFCSEEFERRLGEAGMGKFSLVDRRKLQTALRKEGFQLDDLGSSQRMLQVSKSVGGMPVVAVGTLRNRAGRNIAIQVKLASVDSDEQIGFAAGAAQLNENEWAMLGRSVRIQPSDRTPPIPTSVDAPPASVEDTVVDNADRRSRGPHPLQDPNFEFPVQIVVNGKPRPFVFKKIGGADDPDAHTECFVGLRAGEVYQVWIGNRTEAPMMMRLLVDGLNTLPEQEGVKGITTVVWGKRVNLDEALAWRLNPSDLKRVNGVPTATVSGFFTEIGDVSSKYREFNVVDADTSLAARQKFTDQVGIITAAFYSEDQGGKRALGTKDGKEQSVATKRHDSSVGNLMSVVHIRYVDADTLQRSE